MNADMEAAQILRAGHSFMKTNNTAYSGIDVKSPEELLLFFIRVYTVQGQGLAPLALGSGQDFDALARPS